MSDVSANASARLYEQPRERLRRVGVRNLSLSELLVLLIGSGGSGASAWVVAIRLSDRYGGSIDRLAAQDVAALEHVPGVGTATASRIMASFELGRRAATTRPETGDHIRGPADVFGRMGPRLRDVRQEEFHALLLNTRHRVVREVLVTRGILDGSLIHPREVFRTAVSEGYGQGPPSRGPRRSRVPSSLPTARPRRALRVRRPRAAHRTPLGSRRCCETFRP